MSEPTSPISPTRLWHPLSWLTILGVFFTAQLVCFAIVVVLREALHLPVPTAGAAAGGGVVGVMVVQAMARKRRQPSRR